MSSFIILMCLLNICNTETSKTSNYTQTTDLQLSVTRNKEYRIKNSSVNETLAFNGKQHDASIPTSNFNHSDRNSKEPSRIKIKHWLLTVSTMICISVAGLLAVLSVPIMQKVFYDKIITFLIALAVACLTGDALLHLMPHALEVQHGDGTDDETSVHRQATLKALCAVAGLYIFLISERLGKRRSLQKASRSRTPILDNTINTTTDSNIEDPQSESLLPDNHLSSNHEYDAYQHHGHHHDHHYNETTSATANRGVAYMLVIGDALHNFADGLAIGASFSNSITAGICTAIAVVCHELPHEIGLFAVLLKLKLSVKLAICFNCVSSVMSIIGATFGLYVGQLWNIAPYIFGLIAGIFIYLALVDMLPELTIDPNALLSGFILENIGFACGLTIMSIIAIYESELNKWMSRNN